MDGRLGFQVLHVITELQELRKNEEERREVP